MHDHINSDIIQHKLDAHTPAPEGVLTYSSVLMPIFKTENGYEFLFCKRSMSLKHQPVIYAFPADGVKITKRLWKRRSGKPARK